MLNWFVMFSDGFVSVRLNYSICPKTILILITIYCINYYLRVCIIVRIVTPATCYFLLNERNLYVKNALSFAHCSSATQRWVSARA